MKSLHRTAIPADRAAVPKNFCLGSQNHGVLSGPTELLSGSTELLSWPTELLSRPTELLSHLTELCCPVWDKILSGPIELLSWPTKLLSGPTKLLSPPCKLWLGSLLARRSNSIRVRSLLAPSKTVEKQVKFALRPFNGFWELLGAPGSSGECLGAFGSTLNRF